MSRTVELRLSRLIVAGLALLVLGLVAGWMFLGGDDPRLEKQDGRLEIEPGDEVGYFEPETPSDWEKESLTSFIIEELYWEDGSNSGYGAPPCLDRDGFGDVQAGVVYVDDAGGYQQVAWVRCP